MQIGLKASIASALLATMVHGVPAQTTPAPPAPAVSPEPATTTATYGDWMLRCQVAAGTGATKHVCEVVQTMQVQGQPEPVAQVALGRAPGSPDLHVVVALPVNVLFPSNVMVGTGENDPQPLELAWKRCIPGACFADAVASVDSLTRWRTATAPGRVTFKDAAGRSPQLPLSFRGLAPALDALAKGQ